MPSDEPLPDRCGAQCRNGGYCTQYPVQGRERCRMHGGTSKRGTEHPNYKHGAFSKHIRESLTEAEQEAVDDLLEGLEDPEEASSIVHELIADAYVKWDRSGDVRFLRELRQLFAEFGVVETPAERFEVEHSGSVDVEHDVPEHVAEAIANAAECNLESGGGDE